MKKQKSEIVLLVLSALFLVAVGIQAHMPTAAPPLSLVEIDRSRPSDAGAAESAPESAAAGIININTADTAALCQLPGIGEALAGRIIAYRERSGPFAAIEEIMEVRGIGEKTFEDIKALISCEEDEK